ncbi:hypothetical protein DFH07DRAFT_311170 [Mycena maculata]|uniref:Uncharacterized protein n=1 Tax=Mycena maculata TaxID=230809 RepID=A0AAD7JMA5_9AGAR|nr:hypothetical protein DFH07DRAFT_311170 [Mycena maculata]
MSPWPSFGLRYKSFAYVWRFGAVLLLHCNCPYSFMCGSALYQAFGAFCFASPTTEQFSTAASPSELAPPHIQERAGAMVLQWLEPVFSLDAILRDEFSCYIDTYGTQMHQIPYHRGILVEPSSVILLRLICCLTSAITMVCAPRNHAATIRVPNLVFQSAESSSQRTHTHHRTTRVCPVRIEYAGMWM